MNKDYIKILNENKKFRKYIDELKKYKVIIQTGEIYYDYKFRDNMMKIY